MSQIQQRRLRVDSRRIHPAPVGAWRRARLLDYRIPAFGRRGGIARGWFAHGNHGAAAAPAIGWIVRAPEGGVVAQGVARIAPGVAGLAAFAGPARPAVAGDDCAEVAAKLGQRRALGHALFYGCAQVGWTAAGERDHHRRAPARAGSDGLKQQVLADWLKAPLQRVKMLAAGEVKYLTRGEHEALVAKLNISPF